MTTSSASFVAPVVRYIQAEYLESPGLRLTARQIQRLWCLDSDQCEAALTALVDARFLRRTHAGEFVRLD